MSAGVRCLASRMGFADGLFEGLLGLLEFRLRPRQVLTLGFFDVSFRFGPLLGEIHQPGLVRGLFLLALAFAAALPRRQIGLALVGDLLLPLLASVLDVLHVSREVFVGHALRRLGLLLGQVSKEREQVQPPFGEPVLDQPLARVRSLVKSIHVRDRNATTLVHVSAIKAVLSIQAISRPCHTSSTTIWAPYHRS